MSAVRHLVTKAQALGNCLAIVQKCIDKRGYDSLILSGLHISDADPAGKVQCSMVVEDRHLNVNGTLHGGVSATLVDVVGSLAVGAMGYHGTGVSADIQVSYLAAPKVGDKLHMSAVADKVGKTLAFTRVEIFGADNKLAVRGSHTKYVRGMKHMLDGERAQHHGHGHGQKK
ncbi:HotDog domain-containing protein [Catenaria anguillulae PL171]|uniref:Acyl-coenzyme A thioesterase 13 n=1 Tax=Catenaria anguillulae PL171 TaxID=765915 RepID=A0A1Y2HIL8_9FUNG|nr:HotDog domain-containing protein [Catenaria anguillulae PL171]